MLNKYSIYIAALGCSFLFLLVGCKSKLSKEEYLKWMKNEQHGLLKKKQIGDYEFEVQYKSPQFVFLSSTKNVAPEEMNKKILEFQQMQYFDLKIRNVKGTDFIKSLSKGETDYYNRLYYYSFAFQNDLKLQQGDSIYDCQLFHFERSYGLTAARTFVLGFGQDVERKLDRIITIDAHDLGLGIVKIKFKQEDIDHIPEVQL